jgi:hypothetical protein
VNVTLSVAGHSGATIYYTTNGSTPTTGSSVYSSPISLTEAITIKAFATESGYTASSVATASYVLTRLPSVAFDPPTGSMLPTNITLSVSGHTNATIYYTTNGTSATTNSSVYLAPFLLGTNGWSYSENKIPTMTGYDTPSGSVVTYSSELTGGSAPAWKGFDHSAATYWAANSTNTEWVAFEFPSARRIAKYALTSTSGGDAPKDWTLQGWNGSSYVVVDTRVSETNWAGLEKREYVSTNSGSYVKYRFNITAGNVTASNPSGRAVLAESEMREASIVVVAFATKTNYVDSYDSYAEYHIRPEDQPQIAPVPHFSPIGGVYHNTVEVGIISSLSGASYKYSTNGTDWVDYTGLISVATNTTIRAYTYKTGYQDSSIKTNSYSFSVAPTTISPNGGTFTNAIEVTLTNITDGATVQYSINGGSLTNYTVPLNFSPTVEFDLTAVATKANYVSSTNTVHFLVHNPPTISDIADQTVNEDVSTGPLAFTISDAETTASSLILTASSSNTQLVSVASIVFGGSGTNRTVTVTPLTNQFGTATITISVTDAGGSTAQDTFLLTVNSVNDAPIFSAPPSASWYEDALLLINQQVSFTDSDSGTNHMSLSLFSTNGLLSVITNSLTVVSGSNGSTTNLTLTGTLTNLNVALSSISYAPAANYYGNDALTLVVCDFGHTGGGGTNWVTNLITLEVLARNDKPSFAIATNRIVLGEDEGLITITNFAGSISVGPANESTQAFVFLIETTNSAFFAAYPSIGTNGTLTFGTATNVTGTNWLTVVVRDDGGIGNAGEDTSSSLTFQIEISATNDAPQILLVTNSVSINEDATFSPLVVIADPDAGSGTMELSLLVTNGTLSVGTNGITFVVGTNGATTNLTLQATLTSLNASLSNLVYRPTTNFNGQDGLRLVISDGGNSGSGGTLTGTNHIAIALVAVNDPPWFNISTNSLIANEDFTNTLALGTTPISPPADEAAQMVTYTLIPSRVRYANISINPTNGSVSVTAVTNGFGTNVFTITASDGQSKYATATNAFTLAVASVNDLPIVTLISPAANTTNAAGGSVYLKASTDDVDGYISRVEFYHGGTNLIGSVSNAPFAFTWTNLLIGTYQLTGKAVDDSDDSLTSSAVTFVVATDTDGDGVADPVETTVGTDDGDMDTDGDGVSDFWELLWGRNPLVSGVVDDVSNLIRLIVYTPLEND